MPEKLGQKIALGIMVGMTGDDSRTAVSYRSDERFPMAIHRTAFIGCLTKGQAFWLQLGRRVDNA
jgi:hypothetical protein